MNLSAQKGAWVHHDVGFSHSGSVFDAVGENCLIYGYRDSSLVLGYDIIGHEWQEFSASSPFGLGSLTRSAEFAAVIYNDTLAVAYSALTHSFAELSYQGTLLNQVDAAGCSGYMAYLFTTSAFYVFDAGSGAWYAHEYTPLSPAGEGISYVYTGRDYLAATLANAATEDQYTVVAFSHHTLSFDELHGAPFRIDLLDHGYAIYRDAADDNQDYFGGYSAITGSHVLIYPGRDIFPAVKTSGSELHPATVFMYHYDSEIIENEYTRHMYAFETRLGSFVNREVHCMHVNDGTHPIISNCGGETGFFTFWTEGGNEHITYQSYDAAGHGFTIFNSPLVFYGYNYPHGDAAGGSILTSYDRTTVMGFNIQDSTWAMAAIPGPADQQLTAHIAIKNDWSLSSFRRGAQDSVMVYSYHGAGNNMQEFRIKYEPFNTHLSGLNVGCYLERKYTVSGKFHLYSPQNDSWTIHDYPHHDPVFSQSRDYILMYSPTENEIYLFDGVTGTETAIPFGWQSAYSFSSLHKISSDACMVVFDSDSVLHAYSTYTRNVTSHDHKKQFGLRFGQDEVIVFYWSMGDYRDYLAYNALYNCFVGMSLKEYGSSRTHRAGIKTALVTTTNGHLFAFDPYLDTPNAIDEKNPEESGVIEQFDLRQNYPNPFNPTTNIEFRIPKSGFVTLKIYNLLAQVRHVDHQFVETGISQAADMVLNQWNTTYGQQGLGGMFGEGSHPLTKAGRKAPPNCLWNGRPRCRPTNQG